MSTQENIFKHELKGYWTYDKIHISSPLLEIIYDKTKLSLLLRIRKGSLFIWNITKVVIVS
jgi:hypothetical protein